jgi:hypothetical protein
MADTVMHNKTVKITIMCESEYSRKLKILSFKFIVISSSFTNG